MRQPDSHTFFEKHSIGFQSLEESDCFSETSQTWKWYQEWNNLIFLHWKIPFEILNPLIPKGLSLDTFCGSSVLTLVAYTMNNVRHINTPVIPGISDFNQLNLRTYVITDNKPGIYIFHIEAEKILPVFLAKLMSGLPYEKASMKRKQEGALHLFYSNNESRNFSFEACYQIDNCIKEKTEFENWLLNRYYLYQYQKQNLYSFEIQREEWVINQIQFKKLNLNYNIGNLKLNNNHPPILAHYSKGVKALVWERKLIKHCNA